MKNEIKKIVCGLEDGNLKTLVVIRDTNVSIYESHKYSNEELQNHYNEAILELIAKHFDVLEGVKEEEIPDKLSEMGAILLRDEKIITKIEIYDDPIKMVVSYSNGTKEQVNYDNLFESEFVNACKTKVRELKNTYELSFEDLKNLKLYEVFNIKKENTEYVEEETLTTKIKNLVINHKLLAGLVAGAILITGGIKLSKNSSNKGETKTAIVLETEMPTNVPTMKPTIVPTVEPTPVVTPTPTPAPTMNDTMQPLIDYRHQETAGSVIVEEIKDGEVISHKVGDNSYDYSTENLLQVRFDNMSDLGNAVQNSHSRLSEVGTVIYFDKLFMDARDKAYVQYFSRLGNEIILNAYKDDDISYSNYYTKWSCYEVVRCIRDDYPIKVLIDGKEQYIRYSELSREAKEIVLNIAWGNYFPLNKQTISYNGESLIQDDIGDIIIEASDQLTKRK